MFGVSPSINKTEAATEFRQKEGEDPAFEVAQIHLQQTPEGDQVNVWEKEGIKAVSKRWRE